VKPVSDEQPALFPLPAAEADERLSDEESRRFFTMAGRCSGLPECCIAYYLAVRLDGAAQPPVGPEGYLVCSTCRTARSFVPVRACLPGPWCLCGALKDTAFERPRHTRVAWFEVAERFVLARQREVAGPVTELLG